MADNLAVSTGRRKTAVSRVFLRSGSGAIKVNGLSAEKYFENPSLLYVVKQPLDVTDALAKYDILINTSGGGLTGQAGACRHGIARALASVDEANIRPLRASGFLTRDPRMVERKKYGRRGARRRFQFSKR
ncbi:MAG: 30S ribosomal protein S9 [Spirochaetales bacterium]|nr:30S ribosomal protein S9 [Spirochaetales bacterium]